MLITTPSNLSTLPSVYWSTPDIWEQHCLPLSCVCHLLFKIHLLLNKNHDNFPTHFSPFLLFLKNQAVDLCAHISKSSKRKEKTGLRAPQGAYCSLLSSPWMPVALCACLPHPVHVKLFSSWEKQKWNRIRLVPFSLCWMLNLPPTLVISVPLETP